MTGLSRLKDTFVALDKASEYQEEEESWENSADLRYLMIKMKG